MATRPRWRPTICRRCKAHATTDNPVSYRGLCQTCGLTAVATTVRALASKSGPEYEAQQAATKAGLLRYAERLAAE